MKDFFDLLNHSKPKVLFLDIYQEQNYNPGQICKEIKRGLIYFLIGKIFWGYFLVLRWKTLSGLIEVI